MKKKLFLLMFACLAISCVPAFKLPNNVFNPDPRTSYEKKIKRSHPELEGWRLAHENALNSPREIKLPHGGKGVFKADEFPVYAYRFELQAGELLDAEVVTANLPANLFLDLYRDDAPSEPIQSNTANQNTLEFTVAQSGTYILTVQPEAAAAYRCTVLLNKRPQFGFPVAGKSNSAIQSFWEAPRDGGKRRHEGIDIFAKRGTAVVAVTDGTIADTGDRGLGGKQVWQRTGLFGKSIYYAHLDQIAVQAGDAVKTGDTLGFVGNTGNAKGGPPHLHFGIYEGWQGAVNPLPFVYQHKQIAEKDLDQKPGATKRRALKG